MSMFFFDSSALVKRYLTEIGSTWVIAQVDPLAGHVVVVAEITRVEGAAALASRQPASGGITSAERDRLFKLLVQHSANEYRAIPISTLSSTFDPVAVHMDEKRPCNAKTQGRRE